MPKYIVTATMEIDLFVTVEAATKEEAIEIAEDMDGADFEREKHGGGWKICDAYLDGATN